MHECTVHRRLSQMLRLNKKKKKKKRQNVKGKTHHKFHLKANGHLVYLSITWKP